MDCDGFKRADNTMARLTSFDPRTLLKQIAIPLLQKFFEQRGELRDVPWQHLRETKLTGPIDTDGVIDHRCALLSPYFFHHPLVRENRRKIQL